MSELTEHLFNFLALAYPQAAPVIGILTKRVVPLLEETAPGIKRALTAGGEGFKTAQEASPALGAALSEIAEHAFGRHAADIHREAVTRVLVGHPMSREEENRWMDRASGGPGR
jgi:hypothetical protein